MYKYLILSALLALVAVVTTKLTPADINRRLIKSKAVYSNKPVTRQDVYIEEVPYQIAIELVTIAYGSGSLISEDWVLTVAQVMQFPSSWFTLRAGSEHHQSGGSTHLIAKRILHENFTENEDLVTTNDIALLRVNTPFRFDRTRQPLPLYNAGEIVKPGDMSVITGWGIYNVSEILQMVNLKIVSKDICQNVHIVLGNVSQGQICAAYADDNQAPWVTDPGAPLVIRGRLAGIYSWGNGYNPEVPGVFTEVASYRDWIRDRIGF